MGANLLLVPQHTQITKKVEFWSDNLFLKYKNNKFEVIAEGIIVPKDSLYKLCDFPRKT